MKIYFSLIFLGFTLRSILSGECSQSWDCSGDFTFPISSNLIDSIYDGVNNQSYAPILPPGEWDWNSQPNSANWRNFDQNCGKFNKLETASGEHFGWHYIRNEYDSDMGIAFEYFHWSSGTDIVNLGPNGKIHTLDNRESLTYDQAGTGVSGDVLCYRESWSLNFYMSNGNNLLLVGACSYDDPFQTSIDSQFFYTTTTVHLGDGDDFVYVRDASRAAIDLGNGNQGRTDTISPTDGDDTIVIAGNAHDIRVFGGGGSDTVFWTGISRIQQPQSITWLGLNFFGTGGWTGALWDPNSNKVDTLVLDIPPNTPLRNYGETPTLHSLLVHCGTEFDIDEPTESDMYARYCVTCGLGPNDRKTMIFEYQTENVHTGYFYVTDFNKLQLGLNEDAKVYTIDDINCELLEDSITPSKVLLESNIPTKYCNDEIFEGSYSIGEYVLPNVSFTFVGSFCIVLIIFIILM